MNEFPLRARTSRLAVQPPQMVHFCGIVVFALVGFFFVPVSLAQSSRPGMGATFYADGLGTGVTFRVWSPQATSVSVRGTFNSWGTTPMVKEGASELWSVDVPNVAAGSQYKYFINGTYWWKDPRSRQVTTSGYNNASANSILITG